MYRIVKRFFDLIISFLALLILLPLMILTALCIKLESRGPVFFKQKRIGIHKTHFYIYKFRTMYIDAPKDTPTHLFENSRNYITRTGKFLRKTSLDELPQIFNIIAGQMSIVGPRPALWNQFDLIAERDKYNANDVMPGLTGWAQVNGRDELPIEVKARLDGDYVRNFGFAIDVSCFIRTISCVLKSDGLVEGKHDKKELLPG